MRKIGAIIVMLLYALTAIPAHASGAGHDGRVISAMDMQFDAGIDEFANAPAECCSKGVIPSNGTSSTCKAHCSATTVDGLVNRVSRNRVLPFHWPSPLLDRGRRLWLRPPIAA